MFSFFSRRSKESLPEENLRELIQAVEAVELSSRLPTLEGAVALEVAPRLKPLAQMVKNRGAACVAEVGTVEGFSLRSRTEVLPLLNESIDFSLCRFSLLGREMPVLLKEVVRVLKPNAPLLMVDLHPFSRFLQEKHLNNPVAEGGLPPGFEKHFKLFQSLGISLEGVREVFFESAHRKFFEDKRKGLFEKVRRTPFLILLSGRKGGG